MTDIKAIENALDVIKKVCDQYCDDCKGCPFEDNTPNDCQFNRLIPRGVTIKKETFKPHYQEFKIDEDGYFYFNGRRYYYREDVRFEVENAEKFKGFGGWLYRGGGFWSTNAMIHSGCNLVDRVGDTIRDITPAIPTKIRFWRCQE